MKVFTPASFKKVILSREGYWVLGDELNSWTQGGCWVLAQAIKKWVGPQATLYAVRGQGESGALGSALLPIMNHHVIARVGDYYIDADGINRITRVINTWTKVEGLKNVQVETFSPRDTSTDEGLVCPAAAVKRVVALLQKHFGDGAKASAWMVAPRSNPKRPSPPLDTLYTEKMLAEAVDSTKGMVLKSRATVLDKYSLRIYTQEIMAVGLRVAWNLFLGKTLVGTGRLIIEGADSGLPAPRSTWKARAGIAVIAPAYRRQGLYAAVLPILRKKLGVPIESDASMTAGAIGAWKRAGGKLMDRQGDKVFRINPRSIVDSWWAR